jgi:hypothetical protein
MYWEAAAQSVSDTQFASITLPSTDQHHPDAMLYTRGSADDYDNWGRATGDRGWSWKALWPYIMRVRSRRAWTDLPSAIQ